MKIKNINKETFAKVLAFILATGSVYEFVLTRQNENIKVSLKQVIEEFQDDTLLDEAEKENIATYKNNPITKQADKALEYISSYDTLTDEDKKWLDNNVKGITEETLLWSLKSAVANELDVPVNEIQDIELPYTNEYKDLVLCMTYDDNEYKISKKQKYIVDVLYMYYQIKSSNPQNDPDYSVYKEALNSAKILIMTGIKEENNVLESKRSLKEAKKVLTKQ